jgi:hypothetical protein
MTKSLTPDPDGQSIHFPLSRTQYISSLRRTVQLFVTPA